MEIFPDYIKVMTIIITIQSLDPGTYILNNTSLHVAAYIEDMVGSVAFTTNGNAESGGEVIISDISISDSIILFHNILNS